MAAGPGRPRACRAVHRGRADNLGPGRSGDVAGLDASAQLLEVARRRLDGADLRQGDVEALPYADDSFDAVTAFNSVQYASDPVRALREIERVATAGAAVTVTTWGDPERCEARAMLAAIAALLPPPPPGAGGPFALARPGALEALVESAHLSAERAIGVAAPFLYPDVATGVRASLSSGPAQAAVQRVGVDRVRSTVAAVLEQFVQPDASVRLDNVFRVVLARARAGPWERGEVRPGGDGTLVATSGVPAEHRVPAGSRRAGPRRSDRISAVGPCGGRCHRQDRVPGAGGRETV
ncbi:class I SAM-dependent methyltransferase [Geodermatophilus sp. YIM 151500]|uniref:class I SAM-dependent methyltransferase n=1 Tax=Geodermatophilus sp. YIM 151500 TaxID=2984531 RepID=UPI0021E43FA0|nr:class I SAM-dependent methyltransferase [Geodermatophilus sp. YIM 151500]MCV2489595.1 class I SAM-dependent methyltransferase [Geodermatophilus sp. YIM 151500]